jgi:CBS domain-containing protein
MRARDLMTPDPYVVVPGEPVSRAAEIMHERDIGMVPVVDTPVHMRVLGVITDRDIALRCVGRGWAPDVPVERCMSAGPLTMVEPTAWATEVLELMKADRVRRVLVVEDGRLVGVIAQADVARQQGPLHPQAVEDLLERISEPVPA